MTGQKLKKSKDFLEKNRGTDTVGGLMLLWSVCIFAHISRTRMLWGSRSPFWVLGVHPHAATFQEIGTFLFAFRSNRKQFGILPLQQYGRVIRYQCCWESDNRFRASCMPQIQAHKQTMPSAHARLLYSTVVVHRLNEKHQATVANTVKAHYFDFLLFQTIV